ncbi:helix-turn-helix domain-containing protein [Nonomuraea roseoviolacea subsp. roseoviolacea]|uniref:Sugar diacid utilization regulator n=1 Tax=Nonomuraea roseoviolacea subsp. carminata TaxID=160689 RepID=A0ABT1K5Y0_9ACTN|nr:helix-turn-helix domain-containing protein [Nonomuraea roseoviolacea]MCP2348409.1 sugar diacid utilization regulator [Nonomuraea roseoviolacea subsp. carminata]
MVRRYLELLGREASAVEFEGPIIEARAAGADAATIEELERAKVEALKVRALLRRRARREAELSALYDTAGDLAALRDLDAVLEAIVHRARQLLATDTAYMTLHDPERGDTYMRVTDGSISAKFRALRLAMGAGLGGLVAQSATPYATADYFADARFHHKDHIDEAVQEEGLVAILGVPLRLGQRVIGVLMAADRSARPFHQEEVSLLASLAAHAAVAIDNARLLQETRNALEELSTAHRTARAHAEAVERAALAHDRMTSVVLRGGGIEDVAAVVTDVLGGSLAVLDDLGRPIAGPLDGAVGELDAGVFEAAQASRALGRTVRRGDLRIASVDVGGEPLCTLVLRSDDADERILERAALVCALLLLFRRSVAEAEGRVRGELLDDLISRPETPGLADRARRLGVDLGAPHVVVVARHDGQRERAAFWASSQAAVRRGLAAGRAGEVVLLLPGDDAGALAQRVAAELSASLGSPATAGASRAGEPRPEPPGEGRGAVRAGEVAMAYREARRCAEALVALGRAGDGASAAELGFVGLLIGEGRDVRGFVGSVLGPVVDYDARRGTALAATLAAYFGTGGSPSRTAETMHIHVNTVTQRLDRIGKLLGEGWSDPERALEIQLALRLHRLGHTSQP